MRKFLQIILRVFARLILWKYQPLIIAITGSVGKTSTKEAVFSAVSTAFRIWKSGGNYNNEIGVPLTIIGSASGGRNVWAWLRIFSRAIFIFIFPYPYPKVLVLEMAADRPGDIGYLVALAQPKISVITAIGPSHLEFFGKIEKIAREKSRLIDALPEEGTAVLNYDDEKVQAMALRHRGKVIFYGLDPDADVSAGDVQQRPDGILFKIHYRGNVVPARLPGALGKPKIYAALAAAGVGLALDLNLVEIARSFENFQNPPGRLRLLPGVKGTLIVDDTYNAAPASTFVALEAMTDLSGKRMIAVLGDMAELGPFTEEGHRQVGEAVVKVGVNFLAAVGPRAKFIADEARQRGLPAKQIMEFATSEEAQRPVQDLLKKGDIVLVKGSQSMRMEKIVREIMAEPERASELLCRQSADWLDKP